MKKAGVVFLHIGYWLMYALLLSIFFLLSVFARQNSIHGNGFIWWWRLMAGMAVVPGVIGFYSFYSILFSKYFRVKKFLRFTGGAIVSICIAAMVGIGTIAVLINPGFISADNYWGVVIIFCLICFIAFINGVIGLIIKGFIAWYDDLRLKEELQKKNFETELALLKSRLSPHFLFNTLNNIDVLIEKNQEKASAYLNKLSDIMRFMLYEVKTEKISLEKELEYIEKYIELQRIRTANTDYVNYIVAGQTVGIMIEPMLFIPFIENAFKHGESQKENAAIKINFSIVNETIYFECENRYAENRLTDNEHSGLGNELISKRLNLLYGSRHSLVITDSRSIYTVKLTIYTHAG